MSESEFNELIEPAVEGAAEEPTKKPRAPRKKKTAAA